MVSIVVGSDAAPSSEVSMRQTMVIDTDTASDDAVALILALQAKDVDVRAITVVAGNVPLAQASRNARYTVELCGAAVPVYEGALRPLLREPHTAQFFHGQDGLGDQGYPEPRRLPAPGHAASALVDLVRAHPGLTLVTLGPLTNIAMALLQAPDIAAKFGRCVVMGGAACTVGNVTPAAEYNIWCDPEAARICFRSGMPIDMVGWELCRGPAALDQQDIARCRQIGTPLARFAIDCNGTALEANRRLFSEDGIGLPDPVAMAVALDPSMASRKSRHAVDVECEGTLTRGMTVVDRLDVVKRGLADMAGWPAEAAAREPNVTVCWELDVKHFKAMLFAALGPDAAASPASP
jgi:purine nucleosidase